MTMAKEVNEWLESVGLADSCDPDVAVMKDAAQELDDLEGDTWDLPDRERLAAKKSARYIVSSSRKALDRTLTKSDSAHSIQRHRVKFCGVAAKSLGWVDLGLLSNETAAIVLDELKALYRIDASEYAGEVQEF